MWMPTHQYLKLKCGGNNEKTYVKKTVVDLGCPALIPRVSGEALYFNYYRIPLLYMLRRAISHAVTIGATPEKHLLLS